MARLEQSFDVNSAPKSDRPEGDFQPLPAGWYTARITKADLLDTAAGGKRISLRFDILLPTHQGRVVFGNLNIKNASEKAERIGWQQFGEVARAVGLAKVDDTDQLIGKVLDIRLTQRAASGDYPAGNNVKGFKSPDGAVPPVSGGSSSSAASTGTKAPPWAKK